ncbi:MAG: terpene cyclase/mutase family protein [Phycisphaerales bacterium]|nr:terpene cyclase/mutase family protein [Phycisphaerales bacterium]MCB9863121.1 terpene cyclase/mutase family protein [Phycisphaerales bacterium]
METCLKTLRFDPIAPLLSSDIVAIIYHTRRDLLHDRVAPASSLWRLPDVEKRLRNQQSNGAFKYPGNRPVTHPPHHYDMVETWKQFRYLVDQYAMTKRHAAAERAAEFLFSCQTPDGDFRGMIGNQYATYYTGAIMGLLIKAGYANDPRIEKGFRWLLSMRQLDGGWTVPLLTHKLSKEESARLFENKARPLEPIRSKHFSHNWTGMVLRAFAAHPKHRKSKAAKSAAMLLKTRFFKPDVYTSYKSPDYWVKFQFPFWWNHLVAAMDSISRIAIPADDPDVRAALDWFIEHQQPDGLWKLNDDKRKKNAQHAGAEEMRYWISLAICRILSRYKSRKHS